MPDDVAVLDDYIKRAGLPSRSAGIQRAVQMLRYPALENDYAGAWAEWFGTKTPTPKVGTTRLAMVWRMLRGEIWQVDLDPAR